MANRNLAQLTELTTPSDNDFLYILDVSDTSENPLGTGKKIRKDKVDSGASKENIANKQNSLAIDGTGTKYPTVDAVNNALPTSYSKIVYVNTISPTTATIFDLENPPVTNDNDLKNDTANLYIGTDASTWVYLTGTGYVTKTVSSTTSNFNTFGTSVDSGNSKTSHITRSGAVTLTGSLNLAVAKISTTPNTSAGSYDILTRNSSTTALEKKLVSDFLQTTGNQSFSGTKSSTISLPSSPAISISNPISGGAATGISISNSNDGTGIYVNNTSSGSGIVTAVSNGNGISSSISGNSVGYRALNNGTTSNGFFCTNQSSGSGFYNLNLGAGIGFYSDNRSTGTGIYLTNSSTGTSLMSNSSASSTGNLFEFKKNNVITTYTNHLGEIITMSPTATNQVATKGYADAKITQTITNGVTDKSPSEDVVFDALATKQNTITNPVTGTGTTNYLPKFTGTSSLGNSLIYDNGTNVGIGTTTDNGVDKLQVNGSGRFKNVGFQGTFIGSDQGAIDLKRGSTQGFRLFADINDFGIYDLINNTTIFSISNTTGIVKIPNLSGTLTRTVVADASGNLSTIETSTSAYKVYTALLTQTGTNAPTAIVLENTLGGTIVWTRDSAGIYYGTLSGAFSSNKTACFISGTVLNLHFNCYQNSTSSVTVASTNSIGEGVDTAILSASIEIRVYN